MKIFFLPAALEVQEQTLKVSEVLRQFSKDHETTAKAIGLTALGVEGFGGTLSTVSQWLLGMASIKYAAPGPWKILTKALGIGVRFAGPIGLVIAIGAIAERLVDFAAERVGLKEELDGFRALMSLTVQPAGFLLSINDLIDGLGVLKKILIELGLIEGLKGPTLEDIASNMTVAPPNFMQLSDIRSGLVNGEPAMTPIDSPNPFMSVAPNMSVATMNITPANTTITPVNATIVISGPVTLSPEFGHPGLIAPHPFFNETTGQFNSGEAIKDELNQSIPGAP